jgi:4-diphosphocytidyl-2-C-methyl-D-erythritol kinase
VTGTVRVAAQAKINLRLKVLGRDESGYHAIETVFLRLALADSVTVATRDGGGIAVDVFGDSALIVASGPAHENLAAKAAAAYCERASWNPRVEIRIGKAIPVGAGLGGGSADAAAVLRALDALAPSPLPAATLLEVAGGIGSDVPFMVSDHVMALGWGRGERLRALPPLPARPVILAVPPIHVSTRDAYGWLERGRGDSPGEPAQPADGFSSWEQAAKHAENDFSAAVAGRHPVIETMLQSLSARGAKLAVLTGSGSTVFGIFDELPREDDRGGRADWEEIRTATATHVVPLERMD